MKSYEINFQREAEEDLGELRPYDAVRILAAIEASLQHEPLIESRNRKPLRPTPPALAQSLENVRHHLAEALQHRVETDSAEVWELRVGSWRLAYFVGGTTVYVIRIFRKGRKTTGRSLS